MKPVLALVISAELQADPATVAEAANRYLRREFAGLAEVHLLLTEEQLAGWQRGEMIVYKKPALRRGNKIIYEKDGVKHVLYQEQAFKDA